MSVCSLATYTGGMTFGLFGPTIFSPFQITHIARAFDTSQSVFGDVTLRQAAITSAVVGTGITISAYYYDNHDVGARSVSDFEFVPINGTEGPSPLFGKELGVRWIDCPSGYFPLDMLTHEDDGFFCTLDSPLKDLDSAGLAYCHKFSEDEHMAVDLVQYQHAVSTIGVPSVADRQAASIVASAAHAATSSDGDLVFWRPIPIGDGDDIPKGEIDIFDPDWPFADFLSEFGGHLKRSLTRELDGFLRVLDVFWQLLQHDYAILLNSLVNNVEWIISLVDSITDMSISARSFVLEAASVGSASRYAFLVIVGLLGLIRQIMLSMEIDEVVFLAMVLNILDPQSSVTTTPPPDVSVLPQVTPAEGDVPVVEEVSHAAPSLNPKAVPFVPRVSLSAPAPIPVVDLCNERRRPRRPGRPTRK